MSKRQHGNKEGKKPKQPASAMTSPPPTEAKPTVAPAVPDRLRRK